jgi:hypothetical protein
MLSTHAEQSKSKHVNENVLVSIKGLLYVITTAEQQMLFTCVIFNQFLACGNQFLNDEK